MNNSEEIQKLYFNKQMLMDVQSQLIVLHTGLQNLLPTEAKRIYLAINDAFLNVDLNYIADKVWESNIRLMMKNIEQAISKMYRLDPMTSGMDVQAFWER